MPGDTISATATSDIPRLAEMDRTAGIGSSGGVQTFPNGVSVTTGGVSVASGDLTMTAGNVILGSAGGPGNLIRSLQDNIPTIGSSGSGISATSIAAGSTNLAGQVLATLTGVAPGVVIGIVAFDDGPLATAPIAVICSLSGPTAGDAAPCNVGADTYTTSGFTLRSYGPTTVTTAAYVISYFCVFA